MLESVACFVSDLVSNPTFVILSSILGVFGTFFGLWSHFYSNKRKMLTFEWSGNRVITQGRSYLEDIEITHNGNHIDTLTVTKYAIWNNGNKMIEASDIVPSEPLRIYTNDDSKILSAKVTDIVNPANKFEITENPEFNNAAVITFDFISPKEGAVIQILHTGTSSKSLSFAYQIKGGKPQTKRKDIDSLRWLSRLNRVCCENLSVIYSFMSIFFICLIYLLMWDYFFFELKIIMISLLILLCMIWFLGVIHKYSMQVPKKLRMYTDYNK